MITKKMLLLLLMPMSLYLYPITPPPSGGLGSFDPNMSEEQFLNQLMEEINAALPEDQRESFWEEVARETERLEQDTAHMSPEEKEKYLFNLITEETKPDELKAPEIEEKPAKEEPKVKPKKPKVSVEKTQEVMNLVSQIAKSIESFLIKAAAFPDFDGKVVRWLQKGRVTDWQANNWASFHHELNKIVHTLHRFKEKDAKIGFKHLDALLKQEATIQNLKQLQKKLADYETAIKVSPFEIAGMSEQTKNAAINTINSLTESLYRTKLPQELQKIIEEFDPTAKKLREEEEKTAKEALTRSKQFEPLAPVRTAGRPPHRDDFALPSLDDYGLTGRESPRIADRSRRTQPDGASDKQKDASSKGTAGGAKGKADKGKKEAADKKGKGVTDKNKQEKKKPTEAKKDDGQIKHSGIKSNIDGFRRDLDETRNALLETPEFQSDAALTSYLQ